jgi:hypothetical protein
MNLDGKPGYNIILLLYLQPAMRAYPEMDIKVADNQLSGCFANIHYYHEFLFDKYIRYFGCK